MRLLPVPRDVDAPADPHAVVLADVVEKALQRGNAAGPPEQPAVHADAHHLGVVVAGGVAFGIERIEGVKTFARGYLSDADGTSRNAAACALTY